MLNLNKNETDINRYIYPVMYLFVALFLGVMAHLIMYVHFDSTDDINNTYNTRQENLAAKVVRGSILARDGQELAVTRIGKGGTEKRYYPFGETFAHVVGFSTKGRTGIESMANISLLTSNANISEKLSNEMADEKSMGDNIVTTLDVGLQETAAEALGIYKGAIVVTNTATGEILAMVSNPGFDPNTIVESWDALNADEKGSPLLNRATQGLYPPGSTFKIVTLLEFLREGGDTQGYSFVCNGHFTEGDVTVNCYHGSVHGKVDLRTSFAKSCNSSFANIGSGLRSERFKRTAEDLLFNEDLPLKLSYKSGRFECDKGSGEEERLHTAIGQGKTLITPIHMNMITCAIAQGGQLKRPMLLDRIENYEGTLVKRYRSEDYRRIMTGDEADFLKEYMEAVITEGTGSKLAGQQYSAAGKTGSAEFNGEEKGDSHAWFTGFAWTEERPDPIAVTVVVEGAGSGSDYAVPMAKRIFDRYYE